MPDLILASASPWRAAMLRDAGLDIIADAADIDERAVEAPLLATDMPAEDIAAVLAEAKAVEVSGRHPGALVLGADQVLEFDGALHSKPATIDEARRKLLAMRGRSHQLHSALACCRDGETVWRHAATARMTMRDFSPEFLGHYLARIGEAALQSVGSYQVEGLGVQLFERIEGDHFTIVGLPLLPLLGFLRSEGILES